MKRIIFFLLLFPMVLHAEMIPENKAKEIAIEFMQHRKGTRSGLVSIQMVYNGSDLLSRSFSDAPFYVFNVQNGKGFVIVSGDDVTNPILGFSTENTFCPDKMPENLKEWCSYQAAQVNAARQNHFTDKASFQERNNICSSGTNVVVKHETAEWNQFSPYNDDCPVSFGQKAPTGCTITAAAIIMRFHKWPKCGTGVIPGYKDWCDPSITMKDRPLGETYDWEQMPLIYDNTSSEYSRKQVARLMADLGTLLEAQYTSRGGTSAQPREIPTRFTTYMNYHPSMTFLERQLFSDEEWHEILQNALREDGPVLYSGGSKSGGHAFVLDGYTSDKFYSINWGWGGHSNGYFLLESVNIDDENLMDFVNNQNVVINIKRNEEKPVLKEEYLVTEFYPTSKYIRDNVISFRCAFHRTGNAKTDQYYYSLWLVDKNGNMKENLTSNGYETIRIDDLGYQSGPDPWGYIKKGFKPGDRLRLYFKSNLNDEWKLPKKIYEHNWEYIIENEQGKIKMIDSNIVLDYDRATRMFVLTYEKGLTLKVRCEELDVTNQCVITDGKCVLDRNQIDFANLTLTFIKGELIKVTQLHWYKR